MKKILLLSITLTVIVTSILMFALPSSSAEISSAGNSIGEWYGKVGTVSELEGGVFQIDAYDSSVSGSVRSARQAMWKGTLTEGKISVTLDTASIFAGWGDGSTGKNNDTAIIFGGSGIKASSQNSVNKIENESRYYAVMFAGENLRIALCDYTLDKDGDGDPYNDSGWIGNFGGPNNNDNTSKNLKSLLGADLWAEYKARETIKLTVEFDAEGNTKIYVNDTHVPALDSDDCLPFGGEVGVRAGNGWHVPTKIYAVDIEGETVGLDIVSMSNNFSVGQTASARIKVVPENAPINLIDALTVSGNGVSKVGETVLNSDGSYTVKFTVSEPGDNNITVLADSAQYQGLLAERSIHVHSITYTADSENHWINCSCGIIGTQKHTFTHYEEVSPTQTASGVKAYDLCDTCGAKVYQNENGEYVKAENDDELAIVTIITGVCGNDLTWSLNTYNGELTIQGIGAMTSSPWEQYGSSVKSIVICDGVTSISSHAFAKCINAKSVVIPPSIKSIGRCAFFGSTYDVYISDINAWCSINFVCVYDTYGSYYEMCYDDGYRGMHYSYWTPYDQEFYPHANPVYMGNLYLNGQLVTDLVIPSNIKSIGNYAFLGCKSITSVIIPDGVINIGAHAFDSCSNLESVYMSNGVTSIGNWAFNWCGNLESINVSNNVTSIGECAFYGCDGLTSITIPYSVTSIDSSAFEGCSGLTSITIKNGIVIVAVYPYGNYYSDDLTIYSVGNSAAKEYAQKNNCRFVQIDCEICDYIKNTDSKYLAQSESCYAPARYYYSCKWCEKASSDTFEHGELAVHAYSDLFSSAATCTENGMCDHYYCYDCHGYFDVNYNSVEKEALVIPATGHDYETEWSSDSEQHWHECSICGDKKDVAEHVFDDACDTTCDTCGYVRAHVGAYSEHVNGEPATCMEDGVVEHWICECGKIYLDEACTEEADTVVIKKNDNHVIDLANTAWTKGEQTHYKACTCGAKLEEEAHDGLNCTVCLKKTYGVYKVGTDLYFREWGDKNLTGKFYVTTETGNELVPEGWYYADESGKFIKAGFFNDKGTLRYIENGQAYYNAGGAVKVDGKYYFIEWNGRVQIGKFYVTMAMLDASAEKPNTVSGWYYTDETGAVIMDGFYDDVDCKRYIVNGKTAYTRVTEINGKFYMIDWDGEVKTGKFYITADSLNGYLNTSGWYYTYDDGSFINNDFHVDENGVKRYIVNGQAAYTRLTEINGDYYMIDWDGVVVISTDKFYITASSSKGQLKGAGWYKTDADGKIIVE